MCEPRSARVGQDARARIVTIIIVIMRLETLYNNNNTRVFSLSFYLLYSTAAARIRDEHTNERARRNVKTKG